MLQELLKFLPARTAAAERRTRLAGGPFIHRERGLRRALRQNGVQNSETGLFSVKKPLI